MLNLFKTQNIPLIMKCSLLPVHWRSHDSLCASSHANLQTLFITFLDFFLPSRSVWHLIVKISSWESGSGEIIYTYIRVSYDRAFKRHSNYSSLHLSSLFIRSEYVNEKDFKMKNSTFSTLSKQ